MNSYLYEFNVNVTNRCVREFPRTNDPKLSVVVSDFEDISKSGGLNCLVTSYRSVSRISLNM